MAWSEDAARSLAETFDGSFGFERAEEGLRHTTAAAGAPWLYSNFGCHLLGLVLERASGQSDEALVTGRLLEPLAMTCSGFEGAGTGTRLPGHAGGGEVPHWDHPLGTGGVEATIGDLARYAQVRPDGIRVHGGGTGGFSSAVLVDPGRGRPVAMLVSCGAGYSTALGQAALLARPQPPGPEWEDRAHEIVRLLLDGRTADVHARGSATFRSHAPAERVERAWRGKTQDLGPAGEISGLRLLPPGRTDHER